jgi:hypothetical protein
VSIKRESTFGMRWDVYEIQLTDKLAERYWKTDDELKAMKPAMFVLHEMGSCRETMANQVTDGRTMRVPIAWSNNIFISIACWTPHFLMIY